MKKVTIKIKRIKKQAVQVEVKQAVQFERSALVEGQLAAAGHC
jgi:hypothetical protein